MTRTYSNKEDSQANPLLEASTSGEAGQILHLKQLLVTLKKHYEKVLQTSHIQLQAEQNQRVALQKELEITKGQLVEVQKLHEEELQALRDQQMALKELLKKAQDDLKHTQEPASSHSNLIASRQRVEQLERVIPYLRGRTEEANLETEHIREELELTQKRIKALEQELTENKQKSQQEIERLQQLLKAQMHEDEKFETVVSQTSSHHLRQELEMIKQTLVQGTQETKALEARYVEILNEKIGLEHQCKQLQLQLEHQSSNLTSFQTQLHEIEKDKKKLEGALQVKESELSEAIKRNQALQEQEQSLQEAVREKDFVQDKYEQLKEEWAQLTESLDEALEVRRLAEQQLTHLEALVKDQDQHIQEYAQHMQLLDQDKYSLEIEREQLKTLLEESETRLKVAQQHLAKKVKEAALLNEKVEEQQMSLLDYTQTIEFQKNQLAQLQANIEFYQKQEKRLQEQLHEALKGTEGQIAKWEEKYFRMYDKWQESEARIGELKKFEEKHHQMQSLLANLGTFMGTSLNSNALFHAGQESTEQLNRLPSTMSHPNQTEGASSHSGSKADSTEEKYDLFGMRQSMNDKYKTNLFS